MDIDCPPVISANRLVLLSNEELPPPDSTESPHYFEIHDKRCSENALLLFNNRYVFKILRPYEDHRYSLKALPNRQASLIEGLHMNRIFTRNIHLGLARYCGWRQATSEIGIGAVEVEPEQNKLDPKAEYILVMRKLPKKYRLDCLLRDSDETSFKHYETELTRFLSNIHTSSSFPVVSSEKELWGGITQLRNKLIHNFKTVEQPIVKDKSTLQSDQYKSLLATCRVLKNILLPIFENPQYQSYFNERIEKRQIKRCHGDLKARNIWIMPEINSYSEFVGGVNALDAVDFNPDYCNIDTLSDFAMLIADISARTNSQTIANRMISDYLKQTKQEDEAARFVLQYYLVEKAFVGAYVNILYDDSLKLGWSYLKTTKKYLRELKGFLGRF